MRSFVSSECNVIILLPFQEKRMKAISRKTMRFIFASLMVVISIAIVQAQTPPPPQAPPGHPMPPNMMNHQPPGMRPDPVIERMAHDSTMNLTDDQKKHLIQIMQDLNQYRMKNPPNMQARNAKFSSQFTAEKLSLDSLKMDFQDGETSRAAALDFAREKFVEFHDVFTTEQRPIVAQKYLMMVQQRMFNVQ